jgi:hypothetical protein
MTQAGEIERAVFALLTEDEACSRFELATVCVLWGGGPADSSALISRWLACGWIAVADEAADPEATLVRLTEDGWAVARQRLAAG